MAHDYTESMRAAARELESARQLLLDEISHYPTPISGCDAQFNHLIAQRTQVANALNALNQAVFVPTPRTLNDGAGVESR